MTGTGEKKEEKEKVYVRDGGKRRCPVFHGKEDESYELWKKKVNIWYKYEGKSFDCPGGEILMALGDKAFEAVCNVEIDDVSKDDGVKRVFESLDGVFGKVKLRAKYDLILKYMRIQRKDGESIPEFVRRYENVESDCKKESNLEFSEDVKCVHLLEAANLEERQKEVVLAWIGKDDWKLVDFKKGLMNVSFVKDKEEKVTRDKKGDDWYGNRSNYGKGGGRMKNSLDKYGRIKTCVICRSEYHLGWNCPYNGKWECRERLTKDVKMEGVRKEEDERKIREVVEMDLAAV